MPMLKFSSSRSLSLLCTLALIAACGLSLQAQGTQDKPLGLPDDWTHRHVIFSDPGSEDDAFRRGTHDEWLKIHNDPRFMMQQLKREKIRHGGWVHDGDHDRDHDRDNDGDHDRDGDRDRRDRHDNSRDGDKQAAQPSSIHRDWSMDMGSTSSNVGGDNYPAKYSFSVAAPTKAINCAGGSQPDFVVYNTGVAGSAAQASIIAYTNLYTGFCTGTTPQVLWAYNLNGAQIVTSPVLSLDGSQVAFVNSATGTAQLIILKWASTTGSFTGTTHTSTSITGIASCTGLTTVGSPIYGAGIPQGDTIASACSGTSLTLALPTTTSATETITYSNATPTAPVTLSSSTANCKSSTVACMTVINFNKPSGNSAGDTISSPFYDYNSDTLYVGDAGDYLHKFTNVFLGGTAPAEVTATWPVMAGNGSNHALTSPVYDSFSNLVYVANFTSDLAEVTPAGAVTHSATIAGAANDIQEGPIVDGTNHRVYVFDEGNPTNYVDQFALSSTAGTGFASGASPLATANVGTGNSTTQLLYDGDFDNAYYSSANGTGNLYICGNTNAHPTIYQIPITAGTMSNTANTGPALASANTQCSPATEVYNNALSGGPYDWIYVGVRASGSPSGCAAGGCVVSIPVNTWQSATAYTVGQKIVNNHFNIEVVSTAGTSSGTQPTWPAAGVTGTNTPDGGVIWTSEGPYTFTAFTSGGFYTLGTVIVDSNNNLERVTGISGGGQAANSTPVWPTTFGNTVLSQHNTGNNVTFTEQGPLGVNSDAYAGGTSGITFDNISTVTGASQIYFSTLSSMTCATSGTAGGCAVQTSQLAP